MVEAVDKDCGNVVAGSVVDEEYHNVVEDEQYRNVGEGKEHRNVVEDEVYDVLEEDEVHSSRAVKAKVVKNMLGQFRSLRGTKLPIKNQCN